MKHSAALPLLGAILLIGGAEVFFRFSDYAPLKALALASIVAGIVVSGCSPWGKREILWKVAGAALFTGYTYQAARRFSGILKEIPFPPRPARAASFALEGFVVLTALTVSVALAARLVRALPRVLLREGRTVL